MHDPVLGGGVGGQEGGRREGKEDRGRWRGGGCQRKDAKGEQGNGGTAINQTALLP